MRMAENPSDAAHNLIDPVFARANRYFQEAADKDHALACFYLGQAYLFARGVSFNLPMAIKYLKKAVDAQIPEAKQQYDTALELQNNFEKEVMLQKRGIYACEFCKRMESADEKFKVCSFCKMVR